MADADQEKLDELEAQIQAAKHKAQADGLIEDPEHKKHLFSDPDSPEVDAAEHQS